LKQVICVKWGAKFGPEYVNRMYGMLRRNVSGPFRLVCLTDDSNGLRQEIDAYPLPELGCEHPQRSLGKWRKLVLWGGDLPALTGLEGPVLFIDLDSVIVANIDDYFTYGQPDDVITARNWAKPFHRLGQTSVFRFPAGRNPQILDAFRADPQGIADRFRFEQHYVTHSAPGGIKLWPASWTRHFRLHCLPPFPLRYFMQAKLPRGAKIVTFPGGPNPGDVQVGRWLDDDAAFPTRLAHLRAAFHPRDPDSSTWRHVTQFVLPVDWIKKHWVE